MANNRSRKFGKNEKWMNTLTQSPVNGSTTGTMLWRKWISILPPNFPPTQVIMASDQINETITNANDRLVLCQSVKRIRVLPQSSLATHSTKYSMLFVIAHA